MQLQLATLEQAKKLKELGFDEKTQLFYIQAKSGDRIYIPPVALALKWLREVKRICVDIITCQKKREESRLWMYEVKSDNGYRLMPLRPDQTANTYEEAESAGLDLALDKLLKEKNERD